MKLIFFVCAHCIMMRISCEIHENIHIYHRMPWKQFNYLLRCYCYINVSNCDHIPRWILLFSHRCYFDSFFRRKIANLSFTQGCWVIHSINHRPFVSVSQFGVCFYIAYSSDTHIVIHLRTPMDTSFWCYCHWNCFYNVEKKMLQLYTLHEIVNVAVFILSYSNSIFVLKCSILFKCQLKYILYFMEKNRNKYWDFKHADW